MIWLIALLIFSVCDDVKLEKKTDPFTKITTTIGVTPTINIEPFDNVEATPISPNGRTGVQLIKRYPDFKINVYRENEDAFLVIDQTMQYENSHRGEDVLKPVLASNSKLLLLFDDDEVINIRYTGEKNEAIDSFDRSKNQFAHSTTPTIDRRWVSIEGKFRVSQNDIQLLKRKELKLLRVVFENSTTDREFNEENSDYFIRNLRCLEL